MAVRQPNPMGEFLRARRARIRPSDVGIAPTTRRRVAGLRREEAARLAGISPEYYLRLEQGRDQHPSDAVLAGLARALLLDDAATEYLYQVARGPARALGRGLTTMEPVGEGMRQLLESWTTSPAYIQGRRLDVLASNALARRLSPIFTPGVNLVRAAFLDPAVREMWRDWDEMTRATVAGLRAQTAADQSDPRFAALIAEVSEASPAFAHLWAQHDVKPKGSGRSLLIHPSAGELDLAFEKLAVPPFSSGQLVVIYHAEPGSPSEARLARLAA